MTATPSAPETMRATVLVAEATPALAAGTAPTTALVAGAMTQPIARARPKNQRASVSAPVCGSHRVVSASMVARPQGVVAPGRGAGLIGRGGTPGETRSRSAALLEEPAPIISPSAIGLMI